MGVVFPLTHGSTVADTYGPYYIPVPLHAYTQQLQLLYDTDNIIIIPSV